MNQPKIHTTKAWGAKVVTARFPSRRAQGIVIHHTAGANAKALQGQAEVERAYRLARQIQNAHMQPPNNWQDTGNHFLVTRGGVILEGRTTTLYAAMQGRVVRGAHAGDGDANGSYFGIETEGRYDKSWPPPLPLWTQLGILCGWLAYWGDFDTQNILPHKHFKATLCPGQWADHLVELRRDAHDVKVQLLAKLGPLDR